MKKAAMTAALAVAIVVGMGLGAAVAPVAEAQRRSGTWSEPLVQVFGGGSYIGVSVRDVDADDAQAKKLQSATGVVVESVREGSPAEKAGLKAGDVIVEFDGERVRSTRQFTRLVQETPAERQVQTVVMRDGQRTTVSVQPAAPESRWESLFDSDHGFAYRLAPRPAPVPPSPPAAPRAPRAPRPPDAIEAFPQLERFFYSSSGRLGVQVQDLSDQLASHFGTKDGVLVTSVTDNSAAAKAGLIAGDVIVAFNGTAVTTPGELSRQVQEMSENQEFTLEIVRDKKNQTLKGKLEPRQQRRWTTTII
jgi:membrane-associated protease RseP (regulator of RpoE activity)